MIYTQQELVTLGKRYGNPKRSYLLIDPLQAKHLAVSPSAALNMMYTLGTHLYMEFPEAGCIVGFAETATAIAGAAASVFPEDTLYVQTTREKLPEAHSVLNFMEEHSHAVEQRLDIGKMKLPEGAQVLLIDDEISTGKTVANMVSVMRKVLPSLRNSVFSVGSVLNRMPDAVRQGLAAEKLEFSALLTMEQTDYEALVREWEVSAPREIASEAADYTEWECSVRLKNPRYGLSVGEMFENLNAFTEACFRLLAEVSRGRVLVLGTEECMLPALLLGEKLEKQTEAAVLCHATTRSPIGIGTGSYPIRNGFQLRSFYEAERRTYLYNIADYDRVIVVTDSQHTEQARVAMADIGTLFPDSELYLIRG